MYPEPSSERKAAKVLSFSSGRMVVLYENNLLQRATAHVECFDGEGKFLWRAEPVSEVDPFVSIDAQEDELFANTWSGYRATIDLNNGSILSCEFAK